MWGLLVWLVHLENVLRPHITASAYYSIHVCSVNHGTQFIHLLTSYEHEINGNKTQHVIQTWRTGKGLNSEPYRQLSDSLKNGCISEFRYEGLDLGGSFDGEGGFGMGNIRGSESDLVGIGAVHSQWQLTRWMSCYFVWCHHCTALHCTVKNFIFQ